MMKRPLVGMMVFLFSLSLVIFYPPQILAATMYYVDCQAVTNNNTGDNGPGSETNPWQSIQKVVESVFQPGDSILFKKNCTWDTGFQWGSVSENVGLTIDSNGTAQAPITYGAYGSASDPNPKFYNSYSSSDYVYGFHITGDYNILQNFEIYNAKETGIAIKAGANHNFIRNLNIHDVAIGITVIGNNNLIENNTIHDLLMLVNTPANGNQNTNDDAGAVGLKISGSHNEFRGNRVTNAIQPSYDYGVDGGAIDFYGSGANTQQIGNVIHHNWFENNDGVFETGSTNNSQIKDNFFAYNVLINNGKVGVFNVAGDFAARNDNIQMINNVIYENVNQYTFANDRPSHSFFSYWAGSEVATANYVPPVTTLNLYNNIFFGVGVPKFSTHTTFTRENNVIFMDQPIGFPIASSSTNLTTNPQFIDATGHNFHLNAGSPGIDTGTNSRLNFLASKNITTDYDGIVIPQNGTLGPFVDRGAFEFIMAAASPSPPASPLSSPSPSPTACLHSTDTNNDGKVNLLDYTILASQFMQIGNQTADFNCDQKVNLLDYTILASQFNP